MIKRTGIAKTPREHFMRAVDDELAKFERKEKSFSASRAGGTGSTIEAADREEAGLVCGTIRGHDRAVETSPCCGGGEARFDVTLGAVLEPLS